MDWIAVNGIVDDVVIGGGIIVLIVRQFLWRSAQLHRMLVLPTVIIAAGIAYLVIELWGGFQWVAGDWIVVGELLLVAVTGTVMGSVTRFRRGDGGLEYRLSSAGILLWAVFVVIRVGSFWLASTCGADLSAATGLILVSFGVNRVAAIIVVKRRAARRGGSAVDINGAVPAPTPTRAARPMTHPRLR